jgi:beta-lactamase regulating signal transducer with metallopeptidase domain
MNGVILLPAEPLVERVGWTLLHFLWQGVLISKLFAAARGLAGRSIGPRARYIWACAALTAMLLAPIATFALIGSGSPLIPASPSGWSSRSFASAGSQAAAGEWRSALPGISEHMLPWIVGAWLCGVLAFSIRLAGGWMAAARMRSAGPARPAPGEWQCKLDELVARMRISRPVTLIVSSLAQAPAVVGWLRPAILMPVGALAGLPGEHIEALLAHELAHIRRHDYLINILQSMTEALLFYHPSVWWISNEIRAEREFCCDDLAVAVSGDPLTYAYALAAIETERPARLRTAMAANGASLVNRIRRLLDPSQPLLHTQPSPGAALTLTTLLLAGIGAAAMDRTPNVAVAFQRPLPAASQMAISPLPPAAAPVSRRSRMSSRRIEESVQAQAVLSKRDIGDAPASASFGNGDFRGLAEEAPFLQRSDHRQEPVQNGASFAKREGEAASTRYRFGNYELRSWSAVEGEPVLRAIEFRGMTEEFTREVLSRLPVFEGQRVSHAARERIGAVASEYGRRLEFGLFPDGDGGAVLRIHPPGSANAELVRLEPERK